MGKNGLKLQLPKYNAKVMVYKSEEWINFQRGLLVPKQNTSADLIMNANIKMLTMTRYLEQIQLSHQVTVCIELK